MMFDKIKALFSGKKETSQPAAPMADGKEKERVLSQSAEPVVAEEIQESKAEEKPAVKEKPEVKVMPGEKEKSGREEKPERDMAPAEKKAPQREEKAAGKERKERQPVKKAPLSEKDQAAKDLYHCMNQVIKSVYYHYARDDFAADLSLGTVPASVKKYIDEISEGLPEDSAKVLEDCRRVVRAVEEDGETLLYPAHISGLKDCLCSNMLPFYPVFFRTLFEGRVRFSALMAPEILKLFHDLTGKRFSVGYHRRYQGGGNAFEWEEDRYQVFSRDGKQLCDATFSNGMIDTGYARIAEPDPDHDGWDLVKDGQWKDGEFAGKGIHYAYRKPVR